MRLKGRHRLLINRPREEVFKFVATDFFANRKMWRSEVEHLEKTSEGAVGAGTTGYERYTDDAGRQAEIYYVVTEYEPGKKFALRGTANAINEEGVREARTMEQPRTTEYQQSSPSVLLLVAPGLLLNMNTNLL